MRSSRSSTAAALALIVAIASASASAHRRDEYLQAARLAIDPDRVQVDLDLTPGISAADAILTDIDVDRNASISSAEAQSYAARVLGEIRVEVDGHPLVLRLMDSTFPSVEAMRRGEGSIRLQIAAAIQPLQAGVHHVRYASAHRPDIGAYLANALVPADTRVAITDQQRDVDQRHLDVVYVLNAGAAGSSSRRPALYASCVFAALAILWLSQRRSAC